MLRRIGYGLGLLFVLACVAAYPLTWGRGASAYYDDPDYAIPEVSVRHGYISFRLHTIVRIVGPHTREFEGHRFDAPLFERQYLYEVKAKRSTYRFPNGALHVHRLSFPLWMPALAVSLFIAWRWRRRSRKDTAGFPMDTGTSTHLRNSR